MDHLLNLSKAARLVGVSRGQLQRQIQDGELESFEGQVRMGDLAKLYPNSNMHPEIENLERYEKIIEDALIRARYKKMQSLITPDPATLAARAASLNRELSKTRQQLYRFELLFKQLSKRLTSPEQFHVDKKSASTLLKWLDDALQPDKDTSDLYHLLDQEGFYHMMSAQVQLQPSGHDFFVDGNDTLLESSLRVGMPVNYGCSNGNCGKCKARLISGDIKKVRNHDYTLSESEKHQGYFLMCSNTAVNDLVIEAEEANNQDDIPIQSINARIRKLDIHDEIAILQLRMPRTERLRFMAGQYVNLYIDDTSAKHYIASCPCDELNLQFHIRIGDANAFAGKVINETNMQSKIGIQGPYGDFTLNKDSEMPIVFFAHETGFAPIKGLIENAIALDKAQWIKLYLSTEADRHYMHNQARAWADAIDNFEYYELKNQSSDAANIQFNKLEEHVICYVAGPAQWAGPVQQSLSAYPQCEQILVETTD